VLALRQAISIVRSGGWECLGCALQEQYGYMLGAVGWLTRRVAGNLFALGCVDCDPMWWATLAAAASALHPAIDPCFRPLRTEVTFVVVFQTALPHAHVMHIP
jgi:hypothetical protein